MRKLSVKKMLGVTLVSSGLALALTSCQDSSGHPVEPGLSGSTLVPASSLDDGLVAYYPFETDAVDATGNGHDGAAYNDVTFGAGASGTGAHFGPGGYVRVLDHDRLDTDEAMTVTAWVKPTAIAPHGSIFLSKWYSSPIIGDWILRVHPNGDGTGGLLVNAADYDTNYSQTVPGEIYTLLQSPDAPPMQLNEWRFVAMTFGDNELEIYVDGQLVGQVATLFSSIEPDEYLTDHLYIGDFRGVNSSVYHFSGGIDEVRIYDRTLSLQEIRTLYFPMSKDECTNGGWTAFAFRNQGQCVRFVETGQDSRS